MDLSYKGNGVEIELSNVSSEDVEGAQGLILAVCQGTSGQDLAYQPPASGRILPPGPDMYGRVLGPSGHNYGHVRTDIYDVRTQYAPRPDAYVQISDAPVHELLPSVQTPDVPALPPAQTLIESPETQPSKRTDVVRLIPPRARVQQIAEFVVFLFLIASVGAFVAAWQRNTQAPQVNPPQTQKVSPKPGPKK